MLPSAGPSARIQPNIASGCCSIHALAQLQSGTIRRCGLDIQKLSICSTVDTCFCLLQHKVHVCTCSCILRTSQLIILLRTLFRKPPCSGLRIAASSRSNNYSELPELDACNTDYAVFKSGSAFDLPHAAMADVMAPVVESPVERKVRHIPALTQRLECAPRPSKALLVRVSDLL